MSEPIPILLFADSVLGIQLYDWQCKILLNYEAGHGKPWLSRSAAAVGARSCCAFTRCVLRGRHVSISYFVTVRNGRFLKSSFNRPRPCKDSKKLSNSNPPLH